MFVYIEGMDLAGKTILAENLKKNLGNDWYIRSKSLVKFNPIKELADQLGAKKEINDEIAGWLYLSASMMDVCKSSSSTNQLNIIQDSMTIMKSLAYHTVFKNYAIADQFKKYATKITAPDLSVYLTADMKTRERRLMKRMSDLPDTITENDFMVIKNPQVFLEMEKILLKLTTEYFNPLVVDTSNHTEKHICDIVLHLIKENIKSPN